MWTVKQFVYTVNAFLRTKGLGSDGRDRPLLALVHGIPMYIYPNTFETVAYLCQPFEPYTTELFERAIRPTATVLDIGAQFGYYALLAARRVGSAGCVYAFEPVPSNVDLLERNIQLNGYSETIHAVPKAVGNRHTQETLYVYRGSDSHSMYRHPRVAVKETIRVECVTIDEFLGGQRVDVIKMDIEGHEPSALAGMAHTIARSDPLSPIIEFAPAYLRRAGVEPHEYLTQLRGFGFDLQLIDEASHRLKPVPTDFTQPHDPTWYANLYCTKKGFS